MKPHEKIHQNFSASTVVQNVGLYLNPYKNPGKLRTTFQNAFKEYQKMLNTGMIS